MSRTIIASIVSIIVGLLTLVGVTMPADMVAALQGNLEAVVGAVMVLYGIVMWVFRAITNSPLSGLFTKG